MNACSKRRWLLSSAAVSICLALVFFGRGAAAHWARFIAARQLDAWGVSRAQYWLEWSLWLDPDNAETDLMRAACFRFLDQDHRWAEAIASARNKGLPAHRLQCEVNLTLIQSGELYEDTEQHLQALIQAGVPQQDVAAALVHGCLARDDPERAASMLTAWAADTPGQAHNAYMWAVYHRHMDNPPRATTELETALTRQPDHELARAELARLYEDQGQLDQALATWGSLLARAPHSETARIAAARVLRKLGRIDQAPSALAPLASAARPGADVCLEMSRIELESGDYEAAHRWLSQVDPRQFAHRDAAVTTAVAAALAGDVTRAERLFELIETDTYVSVGIRDLRSRLFFDADDTNAATDLERLSEQALDESAFAERVAAEQIGTMSTDGSVATATELYARHCHACHGPDGDGNGRAARHLFPRPRNLRADPFQLVSTENAVASEKDIRRVIRHGMPGTSMQPLEELSEDQVELLCGEVVRMRRVGMREKLIGLFEENDEQIDDAEVEWIVAHRTTARAEVRIPPTDSPEPGSIERGRAVYEKQSCDSCHGPDGVGVRDLQLYDDRHRPTRARDLVHEHFTGGHEPEAIYCRILLGMPGTPHPASKNLTDRELVDLVHFCRSLGKEPKRNLTNYQRATQATGNAYLTAHRLRGRGLQTSMLPCFGRVGAGAEPQN